MTVNIRCDCGKQFRANPNLAGRQLPCPFCGQMHSLAPLERPADSSSAPVPQPASTEGKQDQNAQRAMIVGAIVVALLICLALFWALFGGSGTGDGMGSGTGGGIGNGTGDGVGEGSGGTGLEGDGTGSGSEGGGSGSGEAVSQPASTTQPASPSRPTSSPTTRRSPRPVPIVMNEPGLDPLRVPPRSPPRPRPGGGTSGTPGGGSTGASNVGDDPGARGDVSVTLVWSYSINRQGGDGRGGPDVDMWIVDPKGNRLSTSQEGAAQGPTRDGGRIDHDDLGGHGDGDGGGPERAFWPEGKAPPGKYTYGIRWYQGIGIAKYTVKVYVGKKLHEIKTGTISQNDKGRAIELGTVTTQD